MRNSLKAAPDTLIDPLESYAAIFVLRDGSIEFDLHSHDSTVLVNSFIFLATNQVYDGTLFHRVIKDFVIQGGDPQGTGEGDYGYYLPDKITGHTHYLGTLSMANTGPDTNSAQFFISLRESPWLDKNYSIIGQATKGVELLRGISQGDTLNTVMIRAGRIRLSWRDVEDHWKSVQLSRRKNSKSTS